MREVAGVVLAGGSGLRFGGREPKHFHILGGVPIIIVALRTLAACRSVDWLLAVVSADYVEQTRRLLSEYEVEKKVDVIAGGATRQDSSFNAIKALKGMLDDRDIVVLHDAARPLTPADVIEESVASAIEYGAAVAAVRTSDTVAEVENGVAVGMPERDRLWNMQT
ncbi:MAG: 2-C-methyl-D-erythritol 4-phosphate cytidylyltransferase, partial [Thermoplasmata archaeon]|nr:2-C-methyl-D-erythritol 4-phosphate cytidylyltransferase [Thermoplasmata archaeon]